jgi:hypothetical protein
MVGRTRRAAGDFFGQVESLISISPRRAVASLGEASHTASLILAE